MHEFLTITNFSRNSNESAIDLLILVPHAEIYETARESLLPHFPVLRELDQKALERFCYADADIGSRELAHEIAAKLSGENPEKHIVIADIRAPRSIVDFNRSFENASAPLFHTPQFEPTFLSVQNLLDSYFQRSKHVCHLHTMASNDRTYEWNPDAQEEFQMGKVLDYTQKAYNAGVRKLNLLTGNRAGEYHVEPHVRNTLESTLTQHGYEVAQNEAYSLEDHYPTTECLRKYNGSCLDIPKKYIATVATKGAMDPAEIRVGKEAVEQLARALTHAYSSII